MPAKTKKEGYKSPRHVLYVIESRAEGYPDCLSTRSSSSEICRMKVLEKFIKLKPPLFEGGSDPLAAGLWLNSVKTMFDSIGVLQEYRVRFATYLFDGLAEEWWDLRGNNHNVEITKWKRFETLFRNMYIVQSPNQDMIAQFRRLKQRYSTVAEYHAVFVALCRYDPITTADSVLKCNKLRKGLRLDIGLQLASSAFTDVDELVTVAQLIEADYNERSRKTRRDLEQMSSQGGTSLNGCYSECFLCGSVGHKKCDQTNKEKQSGKDQKKKKKKQQRQYRSSSYAPFSLRFDPYSRHACPLRKPRPVFSTGKNLWVQPGFENGTVPGKSPVIPASIPTSKPTSELKISSE